MDIIQYLDSLMFQARELAMDIHDGRVWIRSPVSGDASPDFKRRVELLEMDIKNIKRIAGIES